jgi:serine protease AprX
MVRVSTQRYRKLIALILMMACAAAPALAGLTITGSNGITATGADGITYVGTSGITATGADGYLTFGPNGITATGADGITATGADGITATGADGFNGTNANGITATGADSTTIRRADGITATGADGITATGADGKTYRADAIAIMAPNGITATGADGITATGADGITATGADSRSIVTVDGITATGVDSLTISSADGITATGADGRTFSISPNGITITGADTITATGAAGINIVGAESFTQTGAAALASALESTGVQTGLKSVDPELAVLLNETTDDSNIGVVVVYHHLPTDSDIGDLQRIGIIGGTRYRVLPMIMLSGTKEQILAVSKFPAVRSLYKNRTLQATTEPEVRKVTGVNRAWQDGDLTTRNANLPVSGKGVTVAVLDTGVDGTHGDLAGRVVQNVKLADTQGLGVGFNYPVNITNLANTDLLYGHGTFVSGVIAGNGRLSGGKYSGVAPEAQVLGLSAGDLNLFYVLSGFDYLLARGPAFNVRVVNCSFSANTVFDTNDPVNIATRMLTDNGISVVFSAGNTGPGLHSLNPYAVAPWVIGVGATDTQGHLASFSSRGDFGSALFRPTLVAPGSSVVSLRGTGVVSVTGVEGLAGSDLKRLAPLELPYYTTASGTSFSAPQVAGVIALMLEANPQLTPAQVRDILQRTATPLAPYYEHEVGAGMLNAHAAVLEAAFSQRRFGQFRAIADRGQVQFVNDPLAVFDGTVVPGSTVESSLSIPENALVASVQIGWGGLLSPNDLNFSLFDSKGTRLGSGNTINLPGLTGKQERVAVNEPAAGAWKVKVNNMLGPVGTVQPFTGVLAVTRAQYQPITDIDKLDQQSRAEIYQSVRSMVMFPLGQRFRPGFEVSRADLATALVLGGRVPQYLPAQPRFTDVRDKQTLIFVESAQNAPDGPLFPDAAFGGRFMPNTSVTRLAAAVALVRAAGYRSEAESQSGLLSLLDLSLVPTSLRGYVAVAIKYGLIKPDGLYFRPQNALTRQELAHAMAVMAQR